MAWSFGPAAQRAQLAVAIAIFGITSCSSASTSTAENVGAMPHSPAPPAHKTSSAFISHIVVVIQENRSFDDLFATFPGADGATQGLLKGSSGDVYVPLKEVDLAERCDFGHGYRGFLKNYDGGKMDGFGLTGNKCGGDHLAAYQYVNPQQIAPYWILAQQYVLADHMFQTQGSGSFTAHQDLIAGGTTINPDRTITLVDYPTASPWGCDAPPGTRTTKLRWGNSHLWFRFQKGPFPCLTYPTLRDLLDAKSVSWKYYSPPVAGGTGAIWNAFDAIEAVRYSNEWGSNVTNSDTQIFTDISRGRLPAVSWVIPDRENSDHPSSPGDAGPSWVASIVNAVGESPYWANTAIIIVWDDWGGFYDHVPPPFLDHFGGLGFRVPMIVVSAYAPRGISSSYYVSHTQYEFGSILKFIENTFELGRLHTTDARATSIEEDCFDFSSPPRVFQQIPSSYSESYFLRQRPSYEAVDDE